MNANTFTSARTASLQSISYAEIADLPKESYLSLSEMNTLNTYPLAKLHDRLAGRYAIKSELSRFIHSRYGKCISLNAIGICSLPLEAPKVRFASNDPTITELSISLAHTKGCATAAVAESGERVGVDIEYQRHFKKETLRSFLTPREHSFLTEVPADMHNFYSTLLWCLKEAYLKARGVGLCVHPQRIEICEAQDGLTCLEDGQVTECRMFWTMDTRACILTHVKIPAK